MIVDGMTYNGKVKRAISSTKKVFLFLTDPSVRETGPGGLLIAETLSSSFFVITTTILSGLFSLKE